MINLATLGEVKREQDSMRVKENITGMHTEKKKKNSANNEPYIKALVMTAIPK